MRNKKGFTLVELLAAIVILGLLIVFALPTVTRMVSNSRDKIYINDAKKMVALAEYKLKANNTVIEKPDPGNCIVVSLLYLDSSDFEETPNGGEYLQEKSFVVVKNTGDDLLYSVMLVEKLKDGGYKGVQLVNSEKLFTSDATKYIVSFKDEEVISVESITDHYINDYLGSDYVGDDGEVSSIYNHATNTDNSAISDYAPHIISAQLVSTSSSNINSLNAKLTLKAEDQDTPRKNLMVYLSTTSYQETDGYAYGEQYTSFFHEFDFGAEGYTLGSNITLYIVVKDPEGNKDRKMLTYNVHPNRAPSISNDSSIKKRTNDPMALITGTLTLIVEDDYDSLNDLQVCFYESMDSTPSSQCNSYQSYYPLFNERHQTDYTFTQCPGGCVRDGLPHYLTVFVKDSMGLISSKVFTYIPGLNSAPTFKEPVVVTSRVEGFTSTGSKNVDVAVKVQDDMDPLTNLSLTISDGINTSSYTLNGNENDNVFPFELGGVYDGTTRNINVSVTDSDHSSSSETVQYTVYNNHAPTIEEFTILSQGTACSNPELCPLSDGGKKDVSIVADISDDIDSYNDLMVCISENESDCIVNSGNEFYNENYVSYAPYYRQNVNYSFNDNSYNGTIHTLYLYVVDGDGKSSHTSFDYRMYQNKGPRINNFYTVSVPTEYISRGSLSTRIGIDIEDDFDDVSQMTITLSDNGIVVDSANTHILRDYIEGTGTQAFELLGTYDGSEHTLQYTITDSSGAFSSTETMYEVYKDVPPIINNFSVTSAQVACDNTVLCPPTEVGNPEVEIYLDVSDDFGRDSVQYCFSETEVCNTFSSYSELLNGDTIISKPYTFSDNGETEKHLYAFVKDSVNSNVVQEELTYRIYSEQPPVIKSGPTLTEYYDENGMVLPLVMFELEAADDHSGLTISYCYKLNGAETCKTAIPYVPRRILNKTNFFPSNFQGKTFKIYAKLKDSDNHQVVSDSVDFTPYKDRNPVIESVDAIPGEDGINVTFLVMDPLDQYQICISKTNTCTDYLDDTYDGSDKEYHTVLYTEDSGTNVSLKLFVKDSYGNVVKKSVTSKNYTQCSAYHYNKEKVEYTFLPDKTYEVPGNLELGEGETVTVQNRAISMDRCRGRCYLYNPVTKDSTSDIFGYYNKTITYYDRFSPDTLCAASSVTSEYQADCSFKDCFLKNDNYNRQQIIGSYLYADAADWSVTINGVPYVSRSHYKRYKSQYTEGNAMITLTETTTKICPQCVADGLYNFNSDDDDPYLRIVEYVTDPDFAGGAS